jgi:hypothetical protein
MAKQWKTTLLDMVWCAFIVVAAIATLPLLIVFAILQTIGVRKI